MSLRMFTHEEGAEKQFGSKNHNNKRLSNRAHRFVEVQKYRRLTSIRKLFKVTIRQRNAQIFDYVPYFYVLRH